MIEQNNELSIDSSCDLDFVRVPDTIRTSGLGSCVGVVVYDPIIKIAGMAHVMLPDSTSSKKKDFNHHKYADTAIPILVETLLKDGARKFALKARSEERRVGKECRHTK